MTHENKPQHTTGTALRDGRTVYVLNANGVNRFFATVNRGADDHRCPTSDAECEATVRLLAASYNAFDSAARKLGVNAVEFAEKMQNGELATLIKFLTQGEDIISGLEAEADIAGIDLNEVRAWWSDAHAFLGKLLWKDADRVLEETQSGGVVKP